MIAIYPITPASPMGELADDWAAAGRTEPVGRRCPRSSRCSPRPAPPARCTAPLQKGALATTFTASQGLLLMIPNMFKIAGELTPAVIHVAARTIATHALSIFGDHTDVMARPHDGLGDAARPARCRRRTTSPLVAHAATLRTRVPFLHFFDGFRTSHEIDKIELLDDDDLRALVREEDVAGPPARGA